MRAIFICAASWALISSAWADEPAPEAARTRFYDFDALKLDGDRVRPQLLYTDAAERAQFERLFALKRSLLPELRREADGAALLSPKGTP
ncbi:hypothetical protein KKF91_20475 [Myxococcota bacterium]|nr:hypothetical protein [Myxococcota bacterium]MBU1432922.1 hypothetical protein [Myxococcota bacterium]MBU1899672.1 hypothetical protein [Myxococcota bacterium]